MPFIDLLKKGAMSLNKFYNLLKISMFDKYCLLSNTGTNVAVNLLVCYAPIITLVVVLILVLGLGIGLGAKKEGLDQTVKDTTGVFRVSKGGLPTYSAATGAAIIGKKALVCRPWGCYQATRTTDQNRAVTTMRAVKGKARTVVEGATDMKDKSRPNYANPSAAKNYMKNRIYDRKSKTKFGPEGAASIPVIITKQGKVASMANIEGLTSKSDIKASDPATKLVCIGGTCYMTDHKGVSTFANVEGAGNVPATKDLGGEDVGAREFRQANVYAKLRTEAGFPYDPNTQVNASPGTKRSNFTTYLSELDGQVGGLAWCSGSRFGPKKDKVFASGCPPKYAYRGKRKNVALGANKPKLPAVEVAKPEVIATPEVITPAPPA